MSDAAAQEFHIPIEEIKAAVPFLLKKEAGKFAEWVDNLDLNHDHKRDVAQVGKVVMALLPFAEKANDAIDFDLLGVWVCDLPFVKNRVIMAALIKDVCHALESV